MSQQSTSPRAWPAEGVTRVPYWVYQDEDVYREEQERIWRGAAWSYLCLEAALHAWENRCAHRGALVCMQARGKAERYACIYHNWVYDHEGNLTTVAFRRGIAGK